MGWRAACSLRHQPCTNLGNYRGRISAAPALFHPPPPSSLALPPRLPVFLLISGKFLSTCRTLPPFPPLPPRHVSPSLRYPLASLCHIPHAGSTGFHSESLLGTILKILHNEMLSSVPSIYFIVWNLALLHYYMHCVFALLNVWQRRHHSRLQESQYCYQYGDAEVVRGRAAPWTPRYG